jgi:hypothetical protein
MGELFPEKTLLWKLCAWGWSKSYMRGIYDLGFRSEYTSLTFFPILCVEIA